MTVTYRDTIRSLGAFLLVVVTAVLPGSGQAQEGRIEGVVRVGEAPVADADVIVPALGRRTRVDGAGRFVFENVRAGRYVVEAQSVRWGRGVATVEVPEKGTVQVLLSLEAVFHLDEMIVSAGASAMRRSEAYQPASVVTSREIVANGQASLGETLRGELGVWSTYFGPGASRPVIRGIGGDRVRILEGGVGVGDASGTSPDHAVGMEARSAERIEVVRGPATLLYGSSAVGGIVNVLDDKIVREPPTRPLGGHIEVLGGTVADERTGSARIVASSGPVVFTGSGLWRKASDYKIPRSAALEANPSETSGILENSAIETRRATAGATLISERGYLGVALSTQQSDYGVPVPHEEGGGEEEAGVTIDLDQRRLDLEGGLRFTSGLFRNLKARFGLADYEHVELEGSQVGTQFFNNYMEARLDSEHSFSQRVHGAAGAQLSRRDFQAVGDEVFVPPSSTMTAALFAYENFQASETLVLQSGLRFERQNAESTKAGVARIDHAVSGSVGANWDVAEILSLALSASRSIKLPNTEELFSNGPHAATQAFEIGNPDLDVEAALGLDLTAHLHGDRIRGSLSLFMTRFSDYIYAAATGRQREGLNEFVYTQGDARFSGLEFEGEADLLEGNPVANRPHLALELMTDFVDAKLIDSDQGLPRIPPFRVGGGLNYRQGPIAAQVSVRYHAGQNELGPFETPTAAFTMVDASLSYRIIAGGLFHDITLVGSNLTDTEARLHTSFLKDYAPLPARELRLIYRLNFGG